MEAKTLPCTASRVVMTIKVGARTVSCGSVKACITAVAAGMFALVSSTINVTLNNPGRPNALMSALRRTVTVKSCAG